MQCRPKGTDIIIKILQSAAVAVKATTVTYPISNVDSSSPAYILLTPNCKCHIQFPCSHCKEWFDSHTQFSSAYECLTTTASKIQSPAPITDNVQDPSRHWTNYGDLGRKLRSDSGSHCKFDALDKIPYSQIKVHRLFFTFYDERRNNDDFAKEFASQTKRNRRIDGNIYIDGIQVHYARYKKGLVQIKSDRSERPILPSDLPYFMRAIKDTLLPIIVAPSIQEWKIVGTDANIDLPITDKKDFHTRFNYNERYVIQAYIKTIEGKHYLRVEAQFTPAVTLAEYPQELEKARKVLLEVYGKQNCKNISFLMLYSHIT